MSTRRSRTATRAAAVLAAAAAPFTIAASAAFGDSTSDGFTDGLERICAGQHGIVVAGNDHIARCENVTPSPYRTFVLHVVDHACEELLGGTFSSAPSFGPSDGSIMTWTCT